MSEYYSIDQDLREAKAMIESLERYLPQNQLYGTVGTGGFFSGGNMPSLTVGAVLMRLRRLDALYDQLSIEQRRQYDALRNQHDAIKSDKVGSYQHKLNWEANSRLDAMRGFFDECTANPKLCPRVYLPEVLRRTLVEEVLIAIGDDLNDEENEVYAGLKKKVRATDARFKRFLKPNEFIWAKELIPAYDEKRFWWLYQRPEEA